jgi:hypothetical protein
MHKVQVVGHICAQDLDALLHTVGRTETKSELRRWHVQLYSTRAPASGGALATADALFEVVYCDEEDVEECNVVILVGSSNKALPQRTNIHVFDFLDADRLESVLEGV